MDNVVVAESKIHGLGVFATRDFAEGEIILAIDDSRVVDDEHPLRIDLGERSYLPLLNEWFIEEHREKFEAVRQGES